MQHKVLVIDAGVGRSTLCKSYHNVLGWPDGVSGEKLRTLGRLQAEKYGVEFKRGQATEIIQHEGEFSVTVEGEMPGSFRAYTILVATGVMDRFPQLPGLTECLGLTVYVCPDCDGYEVRNRRTIVMGSGNTGANMALILCSFTKDIVYVNHEQKPVDAELLRKLMQKNIACLNEAIEEVIAKGEGAQFQGVRLVNGTVVTGERGFIAFGGNEVRSSVVDKLGVERLENKHIVTDPRTKMTNIPRVWAAGDIGVHSEQLTVAMGEGSQAAIWMHKELLSMKEESRSGMCR
jgi:thioredoxin reductase